MAKGTAWSDRSGDERRRTLGRFAILYGVIALLGLAMGWFLIAAVFGAGAIGLFVYRSTTAAGEPEADPVRTKPDWMRAMDDPNAPDRSLPEYRTARRDGGDHATTPGVSADAATKSEFAPPPASARVDPAGPPSMDHPHPHT